VPLFWLNYRHSKGRFAGAAVIEASALVSARMAAAVYGLNDGLNFVSGHEIEPMSARQIPESMIGRLLDDRDLRRLQQALMPKKPPAPSVKVRPGRKPRRTDDAEPGQRPKPIRCVAARRADG
jgi:hypothetical protein